MGKPVSLCLPVDVLTTAEQYEYYPALAQSVDGATRQIPVNAHAYTRREPLGGRHGRARLRESGSASEQRRDCSPFGGSPLVDDALRNGLLSDDRAGCLG